MVHDGDKDGEACSKLTGEACSKLTVVVKCWLRLVNTVMIYDDKALLII